MTKTKLLNTLGAILLFLIAVIIMLVSYLSINKLEYKQSYAYIPHQEKVEVELSNEEAITQINKLNNRTFNVKYIENANFDGQVKLCALIDNTIYLNKELASNNVKFVWTYAHETMHAVNFCLDECKTQYLTFVFLYESNINYFKQIALYQASNMIYSTNKEYDATYYIAQYLKDKQKTA